MIKEWKIKINSLIDWILGNQISSKLPEKDERIFRITASIQFSSFIIAITFWNMPVESQFTNFMNQVNILLFIELILSWILLRRGFLIIGPILLYFSTFLHVLLIDYNLPTSTVYLFYSVLVIMPFLIIHPSKPYLRIVLNILPIIALLTHQIYFEYLKKEHLLGPKSARIDIIIGDAIFSQCVLLLISYIFVRAANRAEQKFQMEHEKSEKLLLNILPKEIALELKENGYSEPKLFEASVCFTDFKGFTQIAEKMKPKELVEELDRCFSYFDSLMSRHKLEKLKTIGDSYMFAGGIPVNNKTHAIDVVLASLEIQNFMNQMKEIKENLELPYWELRLGIHSGELIAGVIGQKKFAYDVWSDTVNTASRCESSGVVGKINISKTTYELIKDFFNCEYRGQVKAKNKGIIDMYFVNGIKPELSLKGEMKVPNEEFKKMYEKLE
ncbi:MAG: adenylate/guanylate cyclase domain-containing protein [Leptospiraceae bacterium]|nr:adenylate/guanylate cyclase domain-containing protein [Leptospiraceae bacterium]